MPATRNTAALSDYRPSYLAAAITGAAVLVLYLVTLAPSTSMWDTSEYISAAYVLGLPHPPGNPLFVLIGRLFAILPVAPTVAQRINVLAALTSAVAAAMWFLVTERVLVSALGQRWQRIVGGVLGAVLGATAFTVWNQSVVNEKVYTVSLMGLAIVSWLTVRWCDDPDGPVADRTLVLIAYLLGLGNANHEMGLLAGPAVLIAVLVRRPETLLRWRLLLACAGVFFLGMTPYISQPIRSAHYPVLNEGEPTTWSAFWYNFNRGQYGKPSVFDRQAPFSGQIGMYWLYFSWQWFRDMAGKAPGLQRALAALFGLLGLLGGYVHWKRDRRSFWYLATFMVTLTAALIFYLNFKYGYSQCTLMGNPAGVPCEVRDRDYFFIVSFSAWGVWAALGLVWVWQTIAAMFGTERASVGREITEVPRQRSALLATPVLLIALIPLFANWTAASRAGQTDTRDFAHDLLDSVEPYGVLITAGDNDTFPLWYAQDVEGIRKDVTVLCTSLLNTDWYIRQLIRRPIYTYDAAAGPAVYRNKVWPKPTGSPLHMTMAQANAIPEVLELAQPELFKQGTIEATVPPQMLERASIVVLNIIRDSYPQRPFYFSRTTGNYPSQLGLSRYLLAQGLARKLEPTPPTETRDTLDIPGMGLVDLARSDSLWTQDFRGPQAIIRRGSWVDRPSVGIPYLYISTAAMLAEGNEQVGDTTLALNMMQTAQQVAKATALEQLFQAPPPSPPPQEQPTAVPLGPASAAPAPTPKPAPTGP